MKNIFRIKDGQIIWPYSFQQLRQDEPHLSISSAPHAGEIASWRELNPPVEIIEYRPTIPPEPSDPRTERFEASEPIETPDGWFQSWTYRPATAEEIAAYDLANLPPPRWGEFSMALVQRPEVSSFLAALPLAVSQALSIALSDIARGGSPEMFCQLLEMYRMPEDLTAKARELATAHDLPQSFVETLK